MDFRSVQRTLTGTPKTQAEEMEDNMCSMCPKLTVSLCVCWWELRCVFIGGEREGERREEVETDGREGEGDNQNGTTPPARLRTDDPRFSKDTSTPPLPPQVSCTLLLVFEEPFSVRHLFWNHPGGAGRARRFWRVCRRATLCSSSFEPLSFLSSFFL